MGSATSGQVFQELGAVTMLGAAYKAVLVDISSFAGQRISILIQAAEASTGSLVEAAVNNETITQQR